MVKARRKTSIVWLTPIDEFKKTVKESITIKEVIIKLGLDFCTSHYKTVNARVKEEVIDISHFNPTANREVRVKTPLEDILTENSSYSRHCLKPRLIEANLLEEKCESCGTGNEWNGKPISLQLDHINGINDDNRIENIRFLCPNCHSQTDTFGARNHKVKFEESKCIECNGVANSKSKSGLCIKCHGKTTRKAIRPSKEVLVSQIAELGYVGTGKIYGVSDNAIRKWLKAS